MKSVRLLLVTIAAVGAASIARAAEPPAIPDALLRAEQGLSMADCEVAIACKWLRAGNAVIDARYACGTAELAALVANAPEPIAEIAIGNVSADDPAAFDSMMAWLANPRGAVRRAAARRLREFPDQRDASLRALRAAFAEAHDTVLQVAIVDAVGELSRAQDSLILDAEELAPPAVSIAARGALVRWGTTDDALRVIGRTFTATPLTNASRALVERVALNARPGVTRVLIERFAALQPNPDPSSFGRALLAEPNGIVEAAALWWEWTRNQNGWANGRLDCADLLWKHVLAHARAEHATALAIAANSRDGGAYVWAERWIGRQQRSPASEATLVEVIRRAASDDIARGLRAAYADVFPSVADNANEMMRKRTGAPRAVPSPNRPYAGDWRHAEGVAGLIRNGSEIAWEWWRTSREERTWLSPAELGRSIAPLLVDVSLRTRERAIEELASRPRELRFLATPERLSAAGIDDPAVYRGLLLAMLRAAERAPREWRRAIDAYTLADGDPKTAKLRETFLEGTE